MYDFVVVKFIQCWDSLEGVIFIRVLFYNIGGINSMRFKLGYVIINFGC